MKFLPVLACMILCMTALPLRAQQQQEERRTTQTMAFPTFQDATVHFSFMRKGKAKANIFLKDGSLLYMQDTVVMKADLTDVLSVDFDTIRYVRIDPTCMGRVIAEKGSSQLACVTTIDLHTRANKQLKGLTDPVYKMDEFGMHLVPDTDMQTDAEQYLLRDKYYFIIRGKVVQANQRAIRKLVRDDKRLEYRALMNEHYWSWFDAESLIKLLDLF